MAFWGILPDFPVEKSIFEKFPYIIAIKME